MKRKFDGTSHSSSSSSYSSTGFSSSASSSTPSIISSVLSGMTTLPKISREGQAKAARKQAIEKFFLDACSMNQRNGAGPNSTLEVEARLGALNQGSFTPGVTREHFSKLYSLLKQKYPCKETQTIQYFYPTGSGDTRSPAIRITYDTRGNCMEALTKANLSKLDIPIGNATYDFRLSACMETEYEQPVNTQVDAGYTLKRQKKRYSFTVTDAGEDMGLWLVELTEVRSTRGNEDSLSFEVEFELHKEACSEIKTQQMRAKIANHLWECVQQCNKAISGEMEALPKVNAERVEKTKERNLRLHMFDLHPSGGSELDDEQKKNPNFPGALPVAFGRAHMSIIQEKDYYVSEKTDGIRYMLFITNGDLKGAYLVNRKHFFYELKDSDDLVAMYAAERPSLFDGEVVTHQPDGEEMFIIFDVLALNGHIYHDQALEYRLKGIGEVVKTYRAFRDQCAALQKSVNIGFTIIGKTFYPKKHVKTLISMIKKAENDKDWIFDDNQKRHHTTDGIIFTPNKPYQPYGNSDLYKWKFMDKISIDFKVDVTSNDPRPKMTFSCRGTKQQGDMVVAQNVQFNQQDSDRFLSDRRANPAPHIVEAGYNADLGLWTYHCLRTDKSQANHIKIAFETLQSIAENITLAELRHRIPLAPSQDNWAEIQRMRFNSFFEEVERNA